MVKIVPILLGVVVSYAVAAALGEVDFSGVAAAPWVGLPIVWDNTVFALFGPQFDSGLATTAIITIMPLAFATMIEHIGDISAIGSTCERNYIADPGLHRTLLGDGLATILASLFGAPANTTYGENTGVLALTRVFDPRVIRIAACCAIVLSFCPKFAAVIAAMPPCVIGGVSLVLYGMISAVGVRNLIENQVDFQNNRNVLVAALVLVLSLGIAYSTAGAIVLELGGVTISLSGLAVGSLARSSSDRFRSICRSNSSWNGVATGVRHLAHGISIVRSALPVIVITRLPSCVRPRITGCFSITR